MRTLIVFFALLAVSVLFTYWYMWFKRRKQDSTNLEKLTDKASYLQSCITVVALIIGAGWVVYTWKIQWEDHLQSTKAAIQIEISASQARPPKEQGLFIAGDITIKNAGTRTEILHFNEGPLFVAKVNSIPIFDATRPVTESCNDDRVVLGTSKRFWLSRPQVPAQPDPRPYIELGDEIRPGVTDVFHFLIRVAEPGTYALMLSLDVPSKESQGPEVEFDNPCDRKKPKYQNRWESPAAFVAVH